MTVFILILLLILATVSAVYFYITKLSKDGAYSKLSSHLQDSNRLELEHYAKILAVMDEIDCAILSNASFEHVVGLLFSHVPSFIPCNVIAVAQLDKDPADPSSTLAATQDGKRHHLATGLDKSLKKILNEHANGYLVEPNETYASIAPLLGLGAKRILMLPLFRDAQLSAVLYLGFEENVQLVGDTRRISRYIADRLSVALTLVLREKSLYYQENFDEVTLLPNRRACRERLSFEISRAQRYKFKIAVLYISLDGFKKVNDATGYAGGDAILKQVGQRLQINLREPDLVSRFGNDEFVVILPNVTGTSGVSKVAEKLIEFLSHQFSYDEHQYFLNSNIGISVYPEDGLTVDLLIQNADTAMARVKAGGVERFMFHEANMNTQAISRLALERDLRKALNSNELFLVYQPQINLRNGKIIGAEVLVRWQHPSKGVIPPIEFIPIAEESDLIEQLGEYVRKMACMQYKTWQAQGIAPSRIALNVSSAELMRQAFTANFLALLQETGVHPSDIVLEITESLLLDVPGHVNTSLQHLRKQGMRIAIDDFGTGYSSLSYLAKLPFDVLKIDRSFLAEIDKPSANNEIVSVIIDLAHHLNKTVCAEGLENETQLEFLKARGCEAAQGYFLSMPLSVEAFEKFAIQNAQPKNS
ncbi:MAG: EAL domain-containing protein [Methylotenera sp.]|nr:EAL domain-containing protein [Methylotenera sp.]